MASPEPLVLLALLACTPAPPTEDTEPVGPDSVVDSQPSPWDTAVEEAPDTALLSHPRGFYDAPFELTLTPPGPAVTLRYSLDGRDPLGPTGHDYAAPLPIDTTTVLRVRALVDGAPVALSATATYLFAADVAAQRAPGDWPDTWWRGHHAGPFAADYELDPEVTDPDPDALVRALEALPVVSILVDPDDLFGDQGIHENYTGEGAQWERPAVMELFEAGDDEGFAVGCALRLQGGSGRIPTNTPKKSFRVLFKSDYGPGRLREPVFEDDGPEEINTLVLRAGYNRSWTHFERFQRQRAQYARERFSADTQRAMGWPAPRVRPVHLFLDGVYWGIYQLQERPDDAWSASVFGGDEADWDALNAGEPVAGDDLAWQALLAAARSFDPADPAAWTEATASLDVDNFVDYMLLNLVLGNADWPDRNWRASRLRSPEGLWRFYSWDAELILVNYGDPFPRLDFPGTPGELLGALARSEELRVRFGDLAWTHLLDDGGALTADVLAARWATVSAPLDAAVVAESARWGDHFRDVRGDPDADLYTREAHWLVEQERLATLYFPNRSRIAAGLLAQEGLLPTTPAPLVRPRSGVVASGTTVVMSTTAGQVLYTLDGSDPRLPGGAVSGAALAYTSPLVVERDLVVSARVRDTDGWGPLARAAYVVE